MFERERVYMRETERERESGMICRIPPWLSTAATSAEACKR